MRFGDTLIPAKCQGCGRIFPDGATFLWAGTGPICGDCAAPSASPPSSCPTCSRAEDLARAAERYLDEPDPGPDAASEAVAGWEESDHRLETELRAAVQSYREAAPRDEEREALKLVEDAARRAHEARLSGSDRRRWGDTLSVELVRGLDDIDEALARLDAVRAARG